MEKTSLDQIIIQDNVVVETQPRAQAIGPPQPTWLVTMAEKTLGFWLGPGDPPPIAQIPPGDGVDYTLAPQIPILLHSVCVGDGWVPELRVTGPGRETTTAPQPVERLGDLAQRWELPRPIEVGPNSTMTMIKLRLVNQSTETRTERDAILMGMPHLAKRDPAREHEAIRTALQEAINHLIDAANRARFAGLHDVADGIMSQAKLVEVLAAHRELA